MLSRLLQEPAANDRDHRRSATPAASPASTNYLKEAHRHARGLSSAASFVTESRRWNAATEGARRHPWRVYDTASAELEKPLTEERASRTRHGLHLAYTSSPMLSRRTTSIASVFREDKGRPRSRRGYTDRNRKRLQQTLTRNRRSIDPGATVRPAPFLLKR